MINALHAHWLFISPPPAGLAVGLNQNKNMLLFSRYTYSVPACPEQQSYLIHPPPPHHPHIPPPPTHTHTHHHYQLSFIKGNTLITEATFSTDISQYPCFSMLTYTFVQVFTFLLLSVFVSPDSLSHHPCCALSKKETWIGLHSSLCVNIHLRWSKWLFTQGVLD